MLTSRTQKKVPVDRSYRIYNLDTIPKFSAPLIASKRPHNALTKHKAI